VKITYDQTYQTPLAEFGVELVRMIKDRAYALISDRFGYALAFDRPLADAIASDIGFCLTGEGRSAIIDMAKEARILVKYFKQPNDANLFGLVECFLPLEQDTGELLAELIVTTSKHNEFHVCLEDVSYAA
jgi:hypothetical protein